MSCETNDGKANQPRTGENHQMFGSLYLKLHNMRDESWTAASKIKQYNELTQLYEKENEVQKLSKQNSLKQKKEDYQQLVKHVQNYRSDVKKVKFGDVQRTKNVLKRHPLYQRTYQYKRSFEVANAMKQKTFWIQQKLDRLRFEKYNLSKEYEARLVDVAYQQSLVKYFFIDEHPEEAQAKKVMVDLNNSETRSRAIKIINKTYRRIIDCLLKDQLYYKPLMDALALDRAEQNEFIQKTYVLGKKAIENERVLSKDYEELDRQIKKEVAIRMGNLIEHRDILKRNQAGVKELVRRDSDFSFTRDRYDRDTKSMAVLKKEMESVEQTIKILKGETLCDTAEEVLSRVENQQAHNNEMKTRMQFREKLRDSINEKEDFAKFVRELLLDDLPQIYNDEKIDEIFKLENAIAMEKNKQNDYESHMRERGELLCSLRFAFQHMLDVLRHVGSSDVYKQQEYANADLKLDLLQFGSMNRSKNRTPIVFEDDVATLLDKVTKKVEILMNYCQEKQKTPDDVNKATPVYQKTIIKELFDRLHIPIKDHGYDDDVEFHDRMVPTNKSIHERSEKIVAAHSRLKEE